ncbi:unnamed protein product [Boreogadus saida]
MCLLKRISKEEEFIVNLSKTAMSGPQHLAMGLLLLCALSAHFGDTRESATVARNEHSLRHHAAMVKHLDRSRDTHSHSETANRLSAAKREAPTGTRILRTFGTERADTPVEISTRDITKKEKFIQHLTGPLYFSPKCRKHVYRLYHSTRDCTTPTYFKRCARLLRRLAGSPQCTDG